MATGTVKWFDQKKAYGFITPDNGGQDIFVHITAIEQAGLRTLEEGNKISFDLESNKGRNSAVNLQLIK
jgi:CspA family cold shock protein